MPAPIRVLVVDDSAVVRQSLSLLLSEAPGIEVVGTARDGLDGVAQAERLRPDVVTMDVEMPRLDGLAALRRLMLTSPRPVIMVSTRTEAGAATTVEALTAGAVDFIPKDRLRLGPDRAEVQRELVRKIRTAARSRVHAPAIPPGGPPASPPPRVRAHAHLVVVGVSTGGPQALHRVLPALPADLGAPVVIVQHMPPHFTRSLAQRLDAACPLHVVEAQPGLRLEPGLAVIARGGEHLLVHRGPRGTVARLARTPEALHTPSVDVLFESAAAAYGRTVLGVVMTGMGKDGLAGARAIRAAGGRVLAQDEATSVVYGMPRAVAEAGLADAVVPLGEIGPAVAEAAAVVAG